MQVKNLRHLAELLDGSEEIYQRFSFASKEIVVLERQKAMQVHGRSLRFESSYNIELSYIIVHLYVVSFISFIILLHVISCYMLYYLCQS